MQIFKISMMKKRNAIEISCLVIVFFGLITNDSKPIDRLSANTLLNSFFLYSF